MVAFLLTALATLFIVQDYSNAYNVGFLHLWDRWDTGQFIAIATNGYRAPYQAAFFPLFPGLERLLSYAHIPVFIAGLIISNVAYFFLLAALYRQVSEQLSQDYAIKTIRVFAAFPTAFFFMAAYNESLFVLFVVLTLYYLWKHAWGYVFFLGCAAVLTRSAGVVLIAPMLYEGYRTRRIPYMIAGPLLGLSTYSVYCYVHFGDALAFSHAQINWQRVLSFPWYGITTALNMIVQKHILSFYGLHNALDGTTCLVLLGMAACSWTCYRGEYRLYGVYTIAMTLFLLIFPSHNVLPLESLSRLTLEVFPVFIVLAAIVPMDVYLLFALPLQAFFILQFLSGRWTV